MLFRWKGVTCGYCLVGHYSDGKGLPVVIVWSVTIQMEGGYLWFLFGRSLYSSWLVTNSQN